jgi:hypothetical protein
LTVELFPLGFSLRGELLIFLALEKESVLHTFLSNYFSVIEKIVQDFAFLYPNFVLILSA